VWQLRRVDFQHFEDKMARKIPTWNGKFINVTGRTAFVKFAITSQAIYHLTPIIIPPPITNNLKKIDRAFLWTANNKVPGGQCTVN
jgi:hypothetical protein